MSRAGTEVLEGACVPGRGVGGRARVRPANYTRGAVSCFLICRGCGFSRDQQRVCFAGSQNTGNYRSLACLPGISSVLIVVTNGFCRCWRLPVQDAGGTRNPPKYLWLVRTWMHWHKRVPLCTARTSTAMHKLPILPICTYVMLVQI